MYIYLYIPGNPGEPGEPGNPRISPKKIVHFMSIIT